MIYFDNNTTTAVAPEVVGAMRSVVESDHVNAASDHYDSPLAKDIVEDSRRNIADLIGATDPDQIVFVRSNDEVDYSAILRVAVDTSNSPHVITSSVENKSVSEAFDTLASKGCRITRLAVDESGSIDLDELLSELGPQTRLVSLTMANNETGTLFPISEIGVIIKERSSALFHVDGANAVGKSPVEVMKAEIDLLSLSGNQFHGPKNIGALYIRKGTNFADWVIEGEGRANPYPGLVAVHEIAGLGTAARLAKDNEAETSVREMRDRLENGILTNIPNAFVNGSTNPDKRLPNTTSISFAGVNGEALMSRLDELGVCVSTSSACHFPAVAESTILRAMNVPYERAMGSIRFSLSRYNKPDEVDHVVDKLIDIVDKLRQFAGYRCKI